MASRFLLQVDAPLDKCSALFGSVRCPFRRLLSVRADVGGFAARDFYKLPYAATGGVMP